MGLRKQRGVVIVVALFIVALVATMSYVMMERVARDTRRTSLILRDAQATAYAQGSVAWAMDQLRSDWEQQQQNKVIDAIPIKSPAQQDNGYTVVSTINDMQARFNVNSLAKKEGQESFKRLIQALVPQVSAEQAQKMAQAAAQWIDAGGKQSELARYYAQLASPYRPASRPMVSVSELRLVRGITPAVYNALMPYVTALPADVTKINVQTAAAPVLMLLAPTLTLVTAKQIEQLRKQSPFTTAQAFLKLDIVVNNHITEESFTVVSQYFLVETAVSIENQHLVLYTLLMRKVKEHKAEVSILWQSKGIW